MRALLAPVGVALRSMTAVRRRGAAAGRATTTRRTPSPRRRPWRARAGLPALADDSGLEVDALSGAPGPRSARYGGPGLDDAGRVALLLRELDGVPAGRRGARFVCVAALATPDGECRTARGVCEGRILGAPRGSGGFGYDPVFAPEGGQRSMAELREDEKNALSHRGRAIAALLEAMEVSRSRG